MSKFNLKFYKKYLQSQEWKNKREEIYKLRNGKCEVCNCKLYHHYHVHHKTYKRLGKELNSDLVLLCEDCHVDLHKKIKTKKNNNVNKLKYYECEFCLNKIDIKKFLNSGKARCPFCNSYINRINMAKQLRMVDKR